MSFLLPLTLLLTPFYALRFDFFGFPTNLLMLWVVLVWLIFIGYIIVKKQILQFFTIVKNCNSIILSFIILFLFAGVISLFAHGFDRQKLGQFIVLFLQPVSIFFIGRYLFEQYPKTVSLLLATCYLLLAISGLFALYQYFTLNGLDPAYWGNSIEPKRATSFFSHPNFYALWSAPLLAFLIPDFIRHLGVILRPHTGNLSAAEESQNKDEILRASAALGAQDDAEKKYAIAKIAAWTLGGIGLLLSLSRAGWLGLAAAVAVYALFAAYKQIRKWISVIVIFIVIVIFSVPNLRYRVLLPFHREKSAVSRLSLWQTGIKGIKESPITGLGLLGFSRQWPTLNSDPNLDTHNYPHNIFLDLWVETGLAGLIGLAGLVGYLIYRGLRNKQTAVGEQLSVINYKLSVSLFLIALLFSGLVDNPYFKNDLAMVFWIILSLI